MYKVGDKISRDQYTDAANWCNSHHEEKLIISLIDGEYVITKIPDPTTEEKAAQVRNIRNGLLFQTDVIVSAPDYPITEEEKSQYIQYRKYLRDIPFGDEFPDVEVLSFERWAAK